MDDLSLFVFHTHRVCFWRVSDEDPSLVSACVSVCSVLRVFLCMPSSLCSTDTRHEQTEIQRTHLGVFLSIYVCWYVLLYYACILPWIPVYSCIFLYIPALSCVFLCVIEVFLCIPAFPKARHSCVILYIFLYISVYSCVFLYIPVYSCVFLYIVVYSCVFLYIPVYSCVSLYIPVYSCECMCISCIFLIDWGP